MTQTLQYHNKYFLLSFVLEADMFYFSREYTAPSVEHQYLSGAYFFFLAVLGKLRIRVIPRNE